MADPIILTALDRVWRIAPPGPDNLLSDARFLALAEALTRRTKTDKAVFALSNALRSLGLPCYMSKGRAPETVDLASVTERLVDSFSATTTRRRHLCPLELADDLPAVMFGPARIASFSAAELESLLDGERLSRAYPTRPVDYGRLAQLQWLVIEETVEIDPQPEARAVPVLYMRMDRDFGAFDPHARRYPAIVEQVLFCLLLAPWEDWSTMLEVDWRGFRLPWIYTVDDDLAVRPLPPPDADGLAFETTGYVDDWGETVEYERPSILNLEDEAGARLAQHVGDTWPKLEASRGSDLFVTPVEHFTVRAYASEGIDELLAQMTVLEAALGEEADHSRALRPKPQRDLGATERMARKTEGLLGDRTAADDYKALFDLRSRFVHGRAGLGTISTDQRIIARRLARRTAACLLDLAVAGAPPRVDVLAQLLARGAP